MSPRVTKVRISLACIPVVLLLLTRWLRNGGDRGVDAGAGGDVGAADGGLAGQRRAPPQRVGPHAPPPLGTPSHPSFFRMLNLLHHFQILKNLLRGLSNPRIQRFDEATMLFTIVFSDSDAPALEFAVETAKDGKYDFFPP